MTGPISPSAEADAIGAFKRYGLVLIGLPAIIVAIVVALIIHGVIIRDLGQVFSGGMCGTICEAYDEDSFGSQDDSEQYASLDQLVRDRVDSGRLEGFRMMSKDGMIIYSTIEDEVGTKLPFDDSLRAAAGQGKASSSVEVRHELLGEEVGRSVLVVGPVRFSEGAPPAGVFQAFKPYEAVAPSIRGAVTTAVITILGGALAAYFLLRLLIVRVEKQISEGEEMVLQVNARLGASLNEMERHFLGTLQTLNAAVDAKDRYTALHSLHVADYACALGGKLGMYDQLLLLERAGLLHDVGKIGLAESALQKTTGLTSEEYESVKEHSRVGATMIETIPFLYEIIPAIMHHHERWDGTGYPDGLSGEEIPALARILAVADAFDAMTTSRPYSSAMSIADARGEIIAGRGSQFDPDYADAFVELIDAGVIIVRDIKTTIAS